MAFEQLYNDLFSAAGRDARQMTREYPWFAPAHFFALQQSQPGDDAFASLATKAALHFGDPLLLHFQINKPTKHLMQASASSHAPVQEVAAEPHEPLAEEQLYEAKAEYKAEEQVPGEQVYEAAAAQPIDNPNFENPEPVEEETRAEELHAEPVPVTQPENDITVHSPGSTEPAEEKTMKNEPALFEPLHTTDYFASQGIKLSEVVQTGDKMARQLRSFTEWLKTMKKVHPEGLNEKTAGSSSIDNTVQTIAELSNKEEEVITEAMAVVFIQQGKLNKAREIYKKLSLLNPSKSAYFAAKLNEIQ